MQGCMQIWLVGNSISTLKIQGAAGLPIFQLKRHFPDQRTMEFSFGWKVFSLPT